MRQGVLIIFLAAALTVLASSAYAELQNMVVGGEVRIEGNYVTNWANAPGPLRIRIPAGFLPARSIGEVVSGAPAFNGLGAVSPFSWDNKSNSLKFVEQRTRLHVRADFTDDVSAFIEFDSYDWWGEDFRSNYVTGADARAVSGNDVEVYQAYIEANQMWGYPLRLRIGRQELSFGSEWLVGPKEFGPFFSGRSFDGVRLTYAQEPITVDVFASKLAENSPIEEDGDIDFYGVYASCTAVENITFDAYWLYVRDSRSLNDTNFVWPIEWVEDIIGVDDYDPTNLHTVGLRGAGTWGALDFNAEAAYQFGDADQIGFNFKPFLYGDDDADFSAWAATVDVGYTFEMAWQPRVHAGYSYYSGEDNRDISFWDWLNPFDRPEASVSFNRLFSNRMYNGFFDLQNDLSNVHVFRAGANLHPLEKVDLMLDAAYFLADEPFDWPAYVSVGRFRVPIAPLLSFWTTESDDDLGVVTDIVGVYHYSEDLAFMLHWSHLFAGDALEDGNYNNFNGLLFNGGSDNDDGDFFTFETRIKF
ncbi:MAG: alginate export family protein [Candidatus Hydrogenedentes bacterium]|nr:alginate export family protein [Candidatus Hydrogenedentota bacterium]